MVLDRLKFFGPQKFRDLHLMRVKPIDVVRNPDLLTVGGSRLPTFREELHRSATRDWQRFLDQATKQLDAAEKNRARVLLYGDPDYPQVLMESAYPSPILYARGFAEVLRYRHAVACVGSRLIREPYSTLHSSFAKAAVQAGFVVVSGFALGADTVGHRAAREASGKTVGVMPGGLDRPFPPENRGLWNELLDYPGAVFVSESPFGARASAMTLRKRNKLIVALSLGVMVSQTSAKGGAMNAYRFAAEERKPVATFEPDESDDTTGNAAIALDPKVQPITFGREVAPGDYAAWLHQFDSWI